MRFLNFTLLFLLLITGCASHIPANTGVEGQVTIGPICPVVRQGQECPDQPYQATLTILTSAGRKVKTFTTDLKGQFQVPLMPGAYTLHPETPINQAMPVGRDESFSVVEGQFAQIKVVYDSGIR